MIYATNIIGWTGAFCCLLGYFLLHNGRLHSRHVFYHILNASGGILLFFSALIHLDMPNVAVNILWALISLNGLWRWFQQSYGKQGR